MVCSLECGVLVLLCSLFVVMIVFMIFFVFFLRILNIFFCFWLCLVVWVILLFVLLVLLVIFLLWFVSFCRFFFEMLRGLLLRELLIIVLLRLIVLFGGILWLLIGGGRGVLFVLLSLSNVKVSWGLFGMFLKRLCMKLVYKYVVRKRRERRSIWSFVLLMLVWILLCKFVFCLIVVVWIV